MKVRDLMKSNPTVITQDCTLENAANTMREIDAGVLPVVEGDSSNQSKRAIGVLTDRDLVIRCVAKGQDPKTTQVTNAFSGETVFCKEDDSLKTAFDTMREYDIGRLLVQNQNGELCGIITMADLISRLPENAWDQISQQSQGNVSGSVSRQSAA
jgi:CBS domain-containing protein